MDFSSDDEYEMSECCEQATKLFWPDWFTPAHPGFATSMFELQMRLIECHLPFMVAADRRRALKTIRYLKARLRRPNDATITMER